MPATSRHRSEKQTIIRRPTIRLRHIGWRGKTGTITMKTTEAKEENSAAGDLQLPPQQHETPATPESTSKVGSAERTGSEEAERALLDAARQVHEAGKRIRGEEGALRAERKATRERRDGLRSRHNELLSSAAIVGTHLALEGRDRDNSWCERFAKMFDARWTAMSASNPRAALIRVMTAGAASIDGIRIAARAVDRVVDEKGAELQSLPAGERLAAVAALFSNGVTTLAGDNKPNTAPARPKSTANGIRLVGPGLEHLKPGEARRAVVQLRADNTVKLLLIVDGPETVQLAPGTNWNDRTRGELEKSAKTKARLIAADDGERLELPCRADLLRHVQGGAVVAVAYVPNGR
jgi:hypothetical protein